MLSEKNISNQTLQGLNEVGLLYFQSSITDCKLVYCGFSQVDFFDCDFTGSHFANCKFIDCTFNGCDFTDAVIESNVIFDECDFKNADVEAAINLGPAEVGFPQSTIHEKFVSSLGFDFDQRHDEFIKHLSAGVDLAVVLKAEDGACKFDAMYILDDKIIYSLPNNELKLDTDPSEIEDILETGLESFVEKVEREMSGVDLDELSL